MSIATTLTFITQILPVLTLLTSMLTKQLECLIHSSITFTVIFTGIVSPVMTTASSSTIKQGDSVHLQLLHFILLSLMCIYCDYISI